VAGTRRAADKNAGASVRADAALALAW